MILIVGPPGAGKSLQAQKLETVRGYKWLSMGRLLRANLDESITEKLDHGELVDDTTTQKILVNELNKIPLETTVLLDGHPRRESQVQWLMEYLKESHRSLSAVIHINISLSVVLERLASRGRVDDTPEVITHRYEQYQSEIIPMLETLRLNGVTILEIEGNQDAEDVHADILKQLNELGV